MKKQTQNKLSLKKFQIARISNPQSIIGGDANDPLTPFNKTKKLRNG